MNEEIFLEYLDKAFDLRKTDYGKIAVDNSQPLYFGRNTIEIDELGRFNKDDLDLFKGDKVFVKSNHPIKGLDLEFFKLYILRLSLKQVYTNSEYTLVEMTKDNIDLFKEFYKQEQIDSYEEYYAPLKHDQYLLNDSVKVYALMNESRDIIVASCIVVSDKLIEEIGVHHDYRYQGLSQVMISHILELYEVLYLHCEEDVIPVYMKHNCEIVTSFEGYEAALDIKLLNNKFK